MFYFYKIGERNLKMKELTPKQKFIDEISKKIENGDWGLEEIEHLEENKIKYHLNYEDIGLFLMVAYDYVYNLAIENGEISGLEMNNLIAFKKAMVGVMPKNKEQRMALKFQINQLVKKFEKEHSFENNLESENKQEVIKKKVKSLYYLPSWLRKPKFTPYSSYYD